MFSARVTDHHRGELAVRRPPADHERSRDRQSTVVCPRMEQTRRGDPCGRPPTKRHMVARTGGEQAPPLRPFAPTPPDNNRLFPARPRPGPGFENRMEQTRRGDPCGRPSSPTNRTESCRPPANTVARTGGEQAPPLRPFAPTPPDNNRLFPARPRPGPGFENRMEQTRRGDPCGRPSSPTNRTESCRPPANTVARTGGEQAPPLRSFAPTPPDNNRLFPARPRHGPGFENRMEQTRRGDPCGRPSSPTNRTESCRPPANTVARTGGEQAAPTALRANAAGQQPIVPCTSASRPRVRKSHGTNP